MTAIDDLFGQDPGLDPDQALRALTDPNTFRWEGTLRDMLDAVRTALQQQKLSEEDIERIAPMVVMQLCSTIGGQVIYLPRGAAVRRALRDARIFDAWRWKGIQPSELARKYPLAVQSIYEIIARQRALARKAEPDLFGFDEEKEADGRGSLALRPQRGTARTDHRPED